MERIPHYTTHDRLRYLPGANAAFFKVGRRLRRAKKTSPAGDERGEDKDAYQQQTSKRCTELPSAANAAVTPSV
jgi:hypothetical protein